MSMMDTTARLAGLLEETLAAGRVPKDARTWAKALAGRLRDPVQVVVMGAPGVGKSSVINMLAGRPAIPGSIGVPVVELTAGREPLVEVENEDGAISHLPGLLEDVTLPDGAVRARQELPDATLERLNFVEVNLTGSQAMQEAVLEWAVERADIVLWCTQIFDANEHRHWAKVPDDLKDHSFLVLTKADKMLMSGTLPERIADLEAVVNEEFLSLFPVATIQAIAAQAGSDHGSASLWKSSGGKALKEEVMRQIANGVSADLDNARLFLSRHADPHELARVDGDAVPVPQQKGPATVRVLHPDKKVLPNGTTVRTKQLDRQHTRLLDDALKSLQSHAEGIFADFSGSDAANPKQVLDRCFEAVSEISDMVMDAGEDNATVAEVREDAMESSEMMVLFRLEDTEDAAIDAVTLLMQLKKEIAERAAG